MCSSTRRTSRFLPSVMATRDPDVGRALAVHVGGGVLDLVELGLDRAVADTLDGDAVLQGVELGLGGVAIGAGAVAADPAGGRQLQRRGPARRRW